MGVLDDLRRLMGEDDGAACLGMTKKLARRIRTALEDGVRSTPYFIINGDRLIAEPDSSGEGQVYTVNGAPLTDEEGVIPANLEADTFRRIITLYKGG